MKDKIILKEIKDNDGVWYVIETPKQKYFFTKQDESAYTRALQKYNEQVEAYENPTTNYENVLLSHQITNP